MDNILLAERDLLEGEQDKAAQFSGDTVSAGVKQVALSSSSSSSAVVTLSPLDFWVQSSSPRTPGEVVHFMLALIRTQYLQARPPQQIKELKNLVEKITESEKGVVITATATSTRDQEVGAAAVDLSSIRKECTSPASTSSATCYTEDNDEFNREKVLGGMKGDLDRVGNKSEKDGKLCRNMNIVTTASCGNATTTTNAVQVGVVGGNETSCEEESKKKEKCASSSIIVPNAEIRTEVLRGLYDVTIGYPPLLAAKQELQGVNNEEEQSFLHPPIRYRIAFAKYIIKQLELSRNWSAPQGSNEESVEEDSAEQETLFLEEWYDGLESLSSSSSRQVLAEPFYRLYEIKVAHHNHKGSSETSGNSLRGNARKGIVKIFEHETSFVADGTTGLVTWKASTEFLKWLTSPWEDGGKLLLERLGEDKEIGWILELGCGCGFLAVALSKCIPATLRQYIATDGSLAALEKAKLNVEANFSENDSEEKLISSRIRFEKVDWQNEETRESFTQLVDGMTCIYGANNGLLLGADIVFDPALIPDLVSLVVDFLEARAGKAILACTIRNETTMELLKKQLASSQLLTRICGRWEDGEILEISRNAQ